MAVDRDTVDALVDDSGDDLSGTVLSKSQFSGILDDLEKGWHLVKTDTQPYVRGNDTTGAIDFGAGGVTAPDVSLKRISASILAVRNPTDSAYNPIDVGDLRLLGQIVIDGNRVFRISSAGGVAPNVNYLWRDNICKAWVNFDGSGTIAIRDDYNISGLVDNGTGDYTITIDTNLASVDHAHVGMALRNGAGTGTDLRIVHSSSAVAPSAAAFDIMVTDSVNALADSARIHVIVFGGV